MGQKNFSFVSNFTADDFTVNITREGQWITWMKKIVW